MRDLAWSLFDRLLPVSCFIAGAWFHRSITRADKRIDEALSTLDPRA